MAALAAADRLRRALRFTDRYLTLAGRSCCAGRSWVGLDRSLARRAPECAPAREKDVPRDP